jgi:hypothetical protein
MSSLLEVMDAIAAQLETELLGEVDGVQVVPRFAYNPTPPCVDVYPADPFLYQAAFGAHEAVFIVRARVAYVDSQAGQELLLDLLDPSSSMSLRAALETDPTFGGVVDSSGPEEAAPLSSGLLEYDYGETRLLGAEWRLRVEL